VHTLTPTKIKRMEVDKVSREIIIEYDAKDLTA
jgi:hypothetical protein